MLSVEALPSGPLGVHAEIIVEAPGIRLTPELARAEFESGRGTRGETPILSAGLGARPRWVSLTLSNPRAESVPLTLSIGVSWIDYLDLYLEPAGAPVQAWRLGDALMGAPGLVAGIGFTRDLVIPPGTSRLLLRAETVDPFALDIQLHSTKDWQAFFAANNYLYGLTYGFLLALLIYNAILYSGLRESSFLYYSLYLASFIFMNLAYTGHGQALWWENWPGFQRYVVLVGMLVTPFFGLLFAQRLLVLEQHAPKIRRGLLWTSLIGIFLIIALALADLHYAATIFAFTSYTLFTVIMVALGLFSLRHNVQRGGYFLTAALAGMIGSIITTMAGPGFIPYTLFTYHAIEWGLMLEATLFALALSSQMRTYQRERDEAQTLAHKDPMTGLHNRRSFDERIARLIGQTERVGYPMTLALFDVDFFKRYNDTYGHAAGDEALKQVAKCLQAEARRPGDMVVRLGGEEFALLLEDNDQAIALQRANAVCDRLIATAIVHADNDAAPVMTISCGIAQRRAADTAKTLFARADAALYAAKKSGRNRVCAEAGADGTPAG